MGWRLDLEDVDKTDVIEEVVQYARATEASFFLKPSGGTLDVGGEDADTVVTHLTGKFPQIRAVEDTAV